MIKIEVCKKCKAKTLEGYKHVCPKWVRKCKKRFHPKKNDNR